MQGRPAKLIPLMRFSAAVAVDADAILSAAPMGPTLCGGCGSVTAESDRSEPATTLAGGDIGAEDYSPLSAGPTPRMPLQTATTDSTSPLGSWW